MRTEPEIPESPLIASYRFLFVLLLCVPFVLLGAEGCDPVPGSGPFQPPGETEGDDDDGEDDGEDDDDDDDEGEDPGAPADPPGEPEPEPEPEPPLVTGITVTGISLYQAVEVPLVAPAVEGRASAAEEAEEDAVIVPVVAGRAALLRAFFTLDATWTMQTVHAEFVLHDGVSQVILGSTLIPRADSTADDLDSTFNVEVPGALVTPLSTVSVRLLASDAGDDPGVDDGPREDAPGATWPADGAAADLGAAENGGRLQVRIVPLRYAPDGSDRLPDTSTEQIELMRSWLERLYPANDVVVTVDAPLAVAAPVLANGNGWSDALYQLTDLREARAVPGDEYVYGMVAPDTSFNEYCRSGCVSGLGWRSSDATAAYTRTSLGLGYAGERAADTFVHEIGHNHGRMHAPCGGPASPDPAYPHGDGRLGAWGYDHVEDALISPTVHADMMGYCRPRWVSDYTWAALSDRIAWVNASASMEPAPGWPKRLRVMDVRADGLARLRGTLPVDRAPEGPSQKIEVLNRRGVVIDVIDGKQQLFEDNDSRAILFEEPTDLAAFAVRLPGGAPLTL